MIDRFYNIYAILERYSLATDDYGQEIKTWLVSTTIYGCKQNKSGSKSIVNNVEKNRTNDRFYCDPLTITTNDRLLFSTNTFSYQGTCSTGSDLASTTYGALYFCNIAFSSYVVGDYVRYSSATTAYVVEEFTYYNILNVYDLLDRYLQIDIDEDNKNRI